ncbi:MAG: DUF4377 domain-containing protein [Clostridia bacterium]|nr:DUF4377 domain-containing protein [Clostridia bacterium]
MKKTILVFLLIFLFVFLSSCESGKKIKGFTYERGHEYELLVIRTILANPPMDSSGKTS